MNKFVLAIIKISIALIVFVAATFTIYFANLDMKLIRFIYDKLQPYYDNLKKDRKL